VGLLCWLQGIIVLASRDYCAGFKGLLCWLQGDYCAGFKGIIVLASSGIIVLHGFKWIIVLASVV
jgi:hypothetical protein